MVALRTPNELPPPDRDPWPTRSIKEHGNDKLFYWASILYAFSIATRYDWQGNRCCLDLFASYGINEGERGERSWGSALLSLLVPPIPFDTYVFADRDPKATDVLGKRVDALRIDGLEIFSISLQNYDAALAQARQVKAARTRGPKIAILTGDANDAPLVARQCLPAFSGQRVSVDGQGNFRLAGPRAGHPIREENRELLRVREGRRLDSRRRRLHGLQCRALPAPPTRGGAGPEPRRHADRLSARHVGHACRGGRRSSARGEILKGQVPREPVR